MSENKTESGVTDEMVWKFEGEFFRNPTGNIGSRECIRAALEAALGPVVAENARLRDGLSALVHCRSDLTRASMREAAMDVLEGRTTSPSWIVDQSPFVADINSLRAQLDQAARVIDDRNKKIADLIADLDTAKSNTGDACNELAVLRDANASLTLRQDDWIKRSEDLAAQLAFMNNVANEQNTQLAVKDAEIAEVRANAETWRLSTTAHRRQDHE